MAAGDFKEAILRLGNDGATIQAVFENGVGPVVPLVANYAASAAAIIAVAVAEYDMERNKRGEL